MRNLNKPPRYNVASIQAQQTLGGDVMQSDEEGQYVTWRDYAWLLAEKQRLDAETSRLKADVERLRDRYAEAMNEMCNLKAEVERLRKAGDAMASLIKYEPSVNTFDPVPQVVKKWNAAKEGKPSV